MCNALARTAHFSLLFSTNTPDIKHIFEPYFCSLSLSFFFSISPRLCSSLYFFFSQTLSYFPFLSLFLSLPPLSPFLSFSLPLFWSTFFYSMTEEIDDSPFIAPIIKVHEKFGKRCGLCVSVCNYTSREKCTSYCMQSLFRFSKSIRHKQKEFCNHVILQRFSELETKLRKSMDLPGVNNHNCTDLYVSYYSTFFMRR